MSEQIAETPTAEGTHSAAGASVSIPELPVTAARDVHAGIPVNGLHRSSDHRYWMNGRGPYPSVTTLLKVLDRPALSEWLKRTVAECAVDNLPELQTRSADRDAAVRWLAQMPGLKRDLAAALGSSVHLLADMAARGQQIDAAAFGLSEREIPLLAAFNAYLARYGASSIVSSEKAVISYRDAYAGTYDLLQLIDGELWLIDIKTGKGASYPEYRLQLAAYGHAEYIILENDPTTYPLPPVQRYGILHLNPALYEAGWKLIPMDVDGNDYVAFLACRELWQWRNAGKGNYIPYTG